MRARSLLSVAVVASVPSLIAGCKKEEPPPPAPAATAAPTATTQPKRGDVEPVGCKGQTTAAACAQCCDPTYWRASFVGGQCKCIKR